LNGQHQPPAKLRKVKILESIFLIFRHLTGISTSKSLIPKNRRFFFGVSMSANRCEHIKDNGVRRGSPAMLQRAFCYFHWRLHAYKLPVTAPEYEIPALDSEGGIQLAVAHVLRGIYSGKLDNKTASVALAAIRLAAQSLRMKETIGSCCMVTETTAAMDGHFQRPGVLSVGNSGVDDDLQDASIFPSAQFLPSVGSSGIDAVDSSTAPAEISNIRSTA
jgi:hypothetical protein